MILQTNFVGYTHITVFWNFECHGISNDPSLDCSSNNLCWLTTEENQNAVLLALCEGRGIPSERASNAEKKSPFHYVINRWLLDVNMPGIVNVTSVINAVVLSGVTWYIIGYIAVHTPAETTKINLTVIKHAQNLLADAWGKTNMYLLILHIFMREALS